MINTIINSFDIWTDAQGIKAKGRIKSIDNINMLGINHLRALVLDLAVYGKLVPQLASDESANELLKKGLKRKSIKDQEPLKEKGQFNHDLPSGWALAYIPNILKDEKYAIKRGPFGSSLRKDFFVSKGYKVYEQQHAIKDDFSLGNYYIDENKYKELKAFKIKSNDIIISCSGTVGKVAIAPNWIEPGIINQALLKLSINETILLNNYFKILFPAFYMKTETLSELQGTAQKNMVSVDILKNEPFPLPPLAEQHRIVAKVDELMNLCDKLEDEQFKKLKTHQALVKTLLATLTEAADTNELQVAWDRIYEHFDTLFCTEDSIEQLKQTILQLAVMGKLVKQDPNDEPANKLLNKIAKEKDRLVKEGKIRKQTPLAKISEDKTPFELPRGWEWTRLGEIGIGSTGKTPSTNVLEYFDGDVPFIGPGQITSEGNITDTDKTLTVEGLEYSSIAEADDLLMVCIGGTIGKCAIVKYKIAFNQQINCIRPLFFNSHFLYDIMNSIYFQQSILSKATGSATPIINRSKWEEIMIPVPSLSEQVRIVQKIDELFTLCESLRNNIKKSEELKGLLSKTII
ncbi:restriction endonuclease subunit S, partial [Flavobacterium sp. UGB4466]|uniref:restriction endonuclease subunit S n=1 Tax=Flavobacterium sp. UGB4466 TaxID=2730889 RepID=UPI00192C90F5